MFRCAQQVGFQQSLGGAQALDLTGEFVDHKALEAFQTVAALFQDHSATQSLHRRGATQNKVISWGTDDGILQAQLNQPLFAGFQLILLQQDHLPQDLRSTEVQPNRRAVSQASKGAVQDAQ